MIETELKEFGLEVQNLKVTGITTAGNIKIESNTLGTQIFDVIYFLIQCYLY